MRLRMIVVTGAVAVLAGCAGVGGGSGSGGGQANPGPSGGGGAFAGTPSGTLKIMGFGGEDEVATSRMAAFKQAYPKVDVSQGKGSFDAQQFLTALASGNPPDVVYMDRNLVGTYAAQGAVVPLEQCVDGQHVDTSQYREAALKPLTLDGKLYGIPEFYVVVTNLVDGKALQDAGVQLRDIQTKDWQALKATSDKLHKSDGGKIKAIGFDPKLPEDFPLWAMANGTSIINDDGSPNLNDPKAVQALDFAASLVEDQGGWASFKAFRDSHDIFSDNNPLSAHAVAAFPMENWYVNVLRDFIPKGLRLQSTIFTDKQGRPISTVGGNAWVIPKGAKNQLAACAFAKTMTDKDTWMKAADARIAKVKQDKSFFTGLFTANKPADEAIKEKYLKDVPDPGFEQAITNYYDVLDVAQALPASPAGSEIDTAWRSAAEKALTGTSAQDALEQAQKEAQAAFDKATKNG